MKNIWTWLPFWTRVWCWAINTCRMEPLVNTVQLGNSRICTRSSKEMSRLLHLSSPQLKTRHGMKWDQSVRSVTCPYRTDAALHSPEPTQALKKTLVVAGDFLVHRSGELEAFVMKAKKENLQRLTSLYAFSCIPLSIAIASLSQKHRNSFKYR